MHDNKKTHQLGCGMGKDIVMMAIHHERGIHRFVSSSIFKHLISCLFIITLLVVGLVQAQEKRHHGAHVHGIARLNIAVEASNIYIEFSSPAANIVGFEHHPRTHDQKNAVKDAVNTLQKGDALFILSAKSQSQLVKSSVETDISEDADHHSEPEHDHDHTEKEHHREAEHHAEENGKAEVHESHSEFLAEYHFTCKKPDELTQIDVRLFNIFTGIEQIEVQLLNETKQTAMDLTAKKNKISL